MSQTYFQIADKLLFFLDSLRNFVAQEMAIIETSGNIIAFQAVFWGVGGQ